MANYAYLHCSSSSQPDSDESEALLAGKNGIPLFWLMGYSEADLRLVQVEMEDVAGEPLLESVPELLTPREQFLRTANERQERLR